MEYYAGIAVSLKESSVCIVDAKGKVVREIKLASEPKHLCNISLRCHCRSAGSVLRPGRYGSGSMLNCSPLAKTLYCWRRAM